MRKIISICCAVILSAILVNGVMFFYERPVAWIDTPNGASGSIRRPGALLVHETEGYGVNTIDALGYLNYDYPLANDYVLMMGASHSLGNGCMREMAWEHITKSKDPWHNFHLADKSYLLNSDKWFALKFESEDGMELVQELKRNLRK